MGWQFLVERVLGDEVLLFSDLKLLTEDVKGLLGAYLLGVLHQEYKRLKKIQEENDWQST